MDCANQDRAGEAVAVGDDVEAVVLPVNAVDVGESGGAVDDCVALGFIFVGVHGWVARFVGFGFYDLAADHFIVYSSNECAAE